MRFPGTSQSGFNQLPVVIKNLLIINVLMFIITAVAQSQFQIDLRDILGLHFPTSEKFRPYQIITYMFMHADIGHIFFNMLGLWMFGNVLENVWGPKRFLIYYLVTGVGAAICHYTIIYFQIHDSIRLLDEFIANPSMANFNTIYDVSVANGFTINPSQDLLNQLAPQEAIQVSVDTARALKTGILNAPNIIGASGAVYGILLAFGMLFPNTEIYMMFIPIPVKAKWAVLIFGCIELYSGLAGSDNIGHFAHLGGMLFGFILIKYWQKNTNTFY